MTPSHQIVYNLCWVSLGRNYSHQFGHYDKFINFAFNTYGFNRGLKQFNQRGEDLLNNELFNVQKLGTFHPKDLDNIHAE